MKNFRKKFLAFSVLSLSGVLLMAGVTGCNSKPKAEVAYGGTATFSSEYFDCYMTQKQGEIEEELVTTSRMTLLESGATGVKIHSYAAPKNSKISWVVEDATGAETNEVKIDENGNVTLPTVTSGRKDYKVWCVAKEVVEEGEGHQVKTAIDLTVVPTGSIATGVQDLRGLSTEEMLSTFSGAEALALETGLAGMNFWAYGGYQKISPRVHTTRSEDGKITSGLYVPGFGFGNTVYGYLAEDNPQETNAAWKRYYHSENSNQPVHVNYFKSSGNDVSDRWSTFNAPLFGKLLNDEDVDIYVPSMATIAEPIPVDEDGNELTGEAAKGTHAHWKVKVNVGDKIKYANIGTTNGSAYNGRAVALEDYLTPYILKYTQYVGCANVSQILDTFVGDADYYAATKEQPKVDGKPVKITVSEFLKNFPGITLNEADNSLTFHLTKPITSDFAAYRLNESGFMPLEFIQDTLGEGDVVLGMTRYGNKVEVEGKTLSNPEDNVLSTGPYVLEKVTEDKIVMKRNADWYVKKDPAGRDVYKLEGLIETKNTLLQKDTTFELAYKQYTEGYTEASSIPTTKLQDMKNDPDTLHIENTGEKNGVSFNCLNRVDYDYLFGGAAFDAHALSGQFFGGYTLGSAGDPETRAAMMPEGVSDWTVKAIMGNHNFQKGLNTGYNRDAFAETLGRKGFSDYFGDINKMTPKADTRYNDSEAHTAAVKSVFGEAGIPTDSKEQGVEYFKKAIKEELEAGRLVLGTAQKPTTVKLNVNWQSQSWVDFQGNAIFSAIEQTIDEAIKSNSSWMDGTSPLLKITFEQTYEGSGPSDYMYAYAKVALGQYDIAQASISGGEYEVFNETGLWESYNIDYSLTIHHALVTNIPSSFITFNGKYYSLDSLYYGYSYGIELNEFGRIDYSQLGL